MVSPSMNGFPGYDQIHKGTWQEIQTVTAATGFDNAPYFRLSFRGDMTGPIPANVDGSCESSVSEVQVVSTSTTGERRLQALGHCTI